MAWPALCLILTLFVCALTVWCLLMSRQVKELQQWRQLLQQRVSAAVWERDHA